MKIPEFTAENSLGRANYPYGAAWISSRSQAIVPARSSCSVTCAHGSCSKTCTGGKEAVCECNYADRPSCRCEST
jgi:hypothetical protein